MPRADFGDRGHSQKIGEPSFLKSDLGVRSSRWYLNLMVLSEIPQVQSLSIREKLELVDDLWKSVSADLDAMEVTQEEKDLLDERWSNFLANPASALTVDQFKIQLHALRA
jgi:putative addiction module component (TIGR02574 family)